MLESLTKEQKKNIIKIGVPILFLIFAITCYSIFFSSKGKNNETTKKEDNLLLTSSLKKIIFSDNNTYISLVDNWLIHIITFAAVNFALLLFFLIRTTIKKNTYRKTFIKDFITIGLTLIDFKNKFKKIPFYAYVKPGKFRCFFYGFRLFLYHSLFMIIFFIVSELIISLIAFFKNKKKYPLKEIIIHVLKTLIPNTKAKQKYSIIISLSTLFIYIIAYALFEPTYRENSLIAMIFEAMEEKDTAQANILFNLAKAGNPSELLQKKDKNTE